MVLSELPVWVGRASSLSSRLVVRWFDGAVMSLITDMSPLLELTLWILCLSGMLILSFLMLGK